MVLNLVCPLGRMATSDPEMCGEEEWWKEGSVEHDVGVSVHNQFPPFNSSLLHQHSSAQHGRGGRDKNGAAGGPVAARGVQAPGTRHGVSAKGKTWSSPGRKDAKASGVRKDTKEAELPVLRDQVNNMTNEWKQPPVQFEEAGDETKPDEDCKVEVDGEADSRRKLDLRERSQKSSERLMEGTVAARAAAG